MTRPPMSDALQELTDELRKAWYGAAGVAYESFNVREDWMRVAHLVQRKLVEAKREGFREGWHGTSGEAIGMHGCRGMASCGCGIFAMHRYPMPSEAPSAPPRIAPLDVLSAKIWGFDQTIVNKLNEISDAVNALVTRESR